MRSALERAQVASGQVSPFDRRSIVGHAWSHEAVAGDNAKDYPPTSHFEGLYAVRCGFRGSDLVVAWSPANLMTNERKLRHRGSGSIQLTMRRACV